MSNESHLKRPFLIDDGELDGINPPEAFVLGYELALFDAKMESPEPFSMLMHSENRERVKWICGDKGREVSFRWEPGDQSESWLGVSVGAK